MKKHRYFLPLAVGVLTIAITGGIIFAQNNNSQDGIDSQTGASPGGPSLQFSPFNQGDSGQIDLSHGFQNQSRLSRVAEILKIKEGVLQSAFAQASEEKQDDSMAYRLEHLVENEKLTQEQANEILAWFQSRPDAAAKLRFFLIWGRDGVEHRLNHMVERGRITQEEANAVLAWHGEMPQAYQDLQSKRFHRSPDSKSWSQFQPSEGFQGRSMNRLGFQGQQSGTEGYAGRSLRWGGMRGGMWGGMQSHMTEGAHGLDPADAQ